MQQVDDQRVFARFTYPFITRKVFYEGFAVLYDVNQGEAHQQADQPCYIPWAVMAHADVGFHR